MEAFKEEVNHIEKETPNIFKLLNNISNDKRIDGSDKENIQALIDLCQTEQEVCKAEIKTEITNLLGESIKKWYTIKNIDDYTTIKKIFLLIDSTYVLPNYESLLNLVGKNTSFLSISYDDKTNLLQVYTKVHPIMQANLAWEFSLTSWESKPQTIIDKYINRHIEDMGSNNNKIDFSTIEK